MDKEHPFAKDKEFFANLPLAERSDWTKKMLETPQKTGQYPIYKIDYPSKAKWSYNNYDINYHFCQKAGKNPKALFFYFHGLNAHGGSSGYMAMNLVDHCGVNAYALDFMNFGQSGGPERGVISSFDELIEQAEGFINFIEKKYEEKKPIYISGLSLGGAICFKMGIRNPEKYAGVVFLSPALKENKQAQPFMKKIGKFMGTFFPKLKLVSQTFNSQSKFDQTERINNDPYIYKDKVIPGSIKVVLDTMEEIEKEWEKFTLPYILVQSGVDKMIDPFVGIDFEKGCSSKDGTIIYCKEMWHAIFGEDELPEIVKIIEKWMQERTK